MKGHAEKRRVLQRAPKAPSRRKPRYRARLALAVCVMCAACAPDRTAKSWFALGTVCSVRAYGAAPGRVIDAVVERVAAIERLFSPNVAGSAVELLRENAGIAPVAVPPEFLFVLQKALFFAELSDGAFDPSIGPLVRLWGIGTERERVPAAADIEAALALVDWRLIQADAAAGTVFLPKAGMSLDFGAIAKGYAADEAARLLREAGVQNAIIDFGGDIIALGAKRRGSRLRKERPWIIGIQDPQAERGANIAVIPCANATLVTSGVYERFIEADGARYHHILSTATGFPLDSGLLSVTVIAPLADTPFAAMEADGLSTVLFAAGYPGGLSALEKLPGREAVFVLKTGAIHATPGARIKPAVQ